MSYTESFYPHRGDRVVFEHNSRGRKGRILSVSDDMKEVFVKYSDGFSHIVKKKVTDIHFIKPCPWWAFWQK